MSHLFVDSEIDRTTEGNLKFEPRLFLQAVDGQFIGSSYSIQGDEFVRGHPHRPDARAVPGERVDAGRAGERFSWERQQG